MLELFSFLFFILFAACCTLLTFKFSIVLKLSIFLLWLFAVVSFIVDGVALRHKYVIVLIIATIVVGASLFYDLFCYIKHKKNITSEKVL